VNYSSPAGPGSPAFYYLVFVMASNLPPDNVSAFRRNTINIVSVEVLFFGFYTCLFFVTLYAVWNSDPRQSRARQTTKIIQTSLLVVSYFLSAMHCAFDWWFPVHMFEVDGASPSLVFDFLAELPPFFLIIEGLTLALNTALTDSVSVWRCWILNGRSFKVIIFPVLCIFTSVVMAIISIVDRISFTNNLQHGTGNITTEIAQWQHLLIAYFAPSLAATFYTTGMIIYSIISNHLRLSKVIRPSFSSGNVAVMVVESALLYTISHMITMGLLVNVSPQFNFSQDILAQMAGISPALLILQVSVKQLHETSVTQVQKVTTLNFSVRNDSEVALERATSIIEEGTLNWHGSPEKGKL